MLYLGWPLVHSKMLSFCRLALDFSVGLKRVDTLTVDLVGTLKETFELIDATDLVECLDSAEGVSGFGIAIFGDSDAERRIEPRDSLADKELLSECLTDRPSSVIKEVVVLLGLKRF